MRYTPARYGQQLDGGSVRNFVQAGYPLVTFKRNTHGARRTKPKDPTLALIEEMVKKSALNATTHEEVMDFSKMFMKVFPERPLKGEMNHFLKAKAAQAASRRSWKNKKLLFPTAEMAQEARRKDPYRGRARDEDHRREVKEGCFSEETGGHPFFALKRQKGGAGSVEGEAETAVSTILRAARESALVAKRQQFSDES